MANYKMNKGYYCDWIQYITFNALCNTTPELRSKFIFCLLLLSYNYFLDGVVTSYYEIPIGTCHKKIYLHIFTLEKKIVNQHLSSKLQCKKFEYDSRL